MEAGDVPFDLLRVDPRRTGVFVDFDGTLAPIVVDPASAAPAPGAADALEALVAAGFRVAVVSGRPVAFLAQHLPATVDVYGLYGLQWRVAGVEGEDAAAAGWRAAIDALAVQAAAELPGAVEVEHKGLSLTLHVRRAPDLQGAVEAWAAAVADETGLHARGAKRSVELHPPVATDKGTVLTSLLAGLSAACFIGDDAGDLPAFDALDAFAASGGTALRVVVLTDETVGEMRTRADKSVTSPAEVVALLESLL